MYEVCRDIGVESRTVIDACKISLVEISPFALHSSYKAAAFLIQHDHKEAGHETMAWLRTIKESLVLKNTRWKVSGEYNAFPLVLRSTFLLSSRSRK